MYATPIAPNPTSLPLDIDLHHATHHSPMADHYAPHRNATFEGYYSRFELPSGWSICLIVSAVPAVARRLNPDDHDALHKAKPFYIVLTYVSPDSTTIVQKEFWPPTFDVDSTDASFTIKWDTGSFRWDGDVVSWSLLTPSATFHASTIPSTRTPWKPGDTDSTPAGLIARLPSPIQWHVHSVSSDCTFQLSIPGLPDASGRAKVHYEKNWAISFPKSYNWLQARDHERGKGICLAGGSLIPGVEAWLVGYQGSHGRYLCFMPFSIFGFTLSGLSTEVSYAKRLFSIDMKGWFRRLSVVATAPAETFFNFAAPLNTGHAPNYCVQSYATHVKVEVAERWTPWSAWTVVEREEYKNGGLEFGGDCYKKDS